MKPSTDLYELIKALSPSEKRYFKLFATRNSSKAKVNYLEIFDLMEQQKSFDEGVLIARLSGKKLRAQYPVQKNYLYKLLLKSLRIYHSEQSQDFHLKELLMNVELLLRKDLVQQANKQLEKARKVALDHEKYEYIPEISTYRISLAMKIAGGNLEKLEVLLEDIFAETQLYFDKYQNIQAYKKLSMQMLVLNRREQQVRTEAGRAAYDALILDRRVPDPEALPSVRATSFYLQTFFIYFFAHREYVDSHDYAERIVALMESHPFLVRERPENYISALQNLVMVSTLCKPVTHSIAMIARLRSFESRFPKVRFDRVLQRKVPLFAYNLELHLLMENGELGQAGRLLPEIDELLERMGYKFNVNEGYVLLDLYFKIARLHLHTGNFSHARNYVNRILNQEGVSGEYEVYLMARILLVVILFEAGEYQMLEYAVISLYRFLRNQKKLFKFEKALIQFIRKSSGIPPGEALNPLFRQLRDDLRQIVEEPDARYALEQFDIITWLDSKI